MKIETKEDMKRFNHTPKQPLNAKDSSALPMHSLACQFALHHILSSNIPGEIAECGVHAGVNLFPLAQLVQLLDPERKVYAFDTFEGLPYGEDSAGEHSLEKGECRTTLDTFLYRGDVCGVTNSIIAVKGRVEDTLPLVPKVEYAFVFLDMDLEVPTQIAVDYFSGQMPDGAIIGFHDYTYIRCPGIEKIAHSLSPDLWRQFGPVQGNTIFYEKLR